MKEEWRAGIYARLSVTGEGKTENSIENQIQMGEAYLAQDSSIRLVKVYRDEGKTGQNFRRPGFLQMMEDVKNGIINSILVKDLSRLGRNYLETGIYVEKVFPALGVRLIALGDGYDSLKEEGEEMVGLKNMVNDFYAKDISNRAKSAKKLKKDMGSYGGGLAPYGLMVKKQGDRRILAPDIRTEKILREIFERFAQGAGLGELERELKRRRIRPPGEYKKMGEVYGGRDTKAWGRGTIREILKNPVYGEIFLEADSQGEGKMEPFISKSVQRRCQRRLEQNQKYGRERGDVEAERDAFAGFVFCGLCGRPLRRSARIKAGKEGEKKRYYRYGCPEMECKVGISLQRLTNVVCLSFCQEIFLWGMDREETEDTCRKAYLQEEKEAAEQRKQLEGEHKRLEVRLAEKYLDYSRGWMSREAFLLEKERIAKRQRDLEEKERDMEQNLQKRQRERERRKGAEKGTWTLQKEREVSELLECFVKRISLYPQKRVEILWNYGQEERGSFPEGGGI